MTFLEATSSGVVQGITEFFPISSSGHLVLLHTLFGLQEPRLLFDLTLHLGTTAAVLILFWRKIVLFLTKEKEFLGYLILGSLPTGFIGVLGGKTLEAFFSQPLIVGWGFWVTAGWLFLAERLKPGKERALNWWVALLVGVSQGIAIVPGISRSGATIGTALLLGVRGETAVQYSFLLSIPAVIGAYGYKLFSQGETSSVLWAPLGKEGLLFAVGALTAMGFGFLAIQWIHRLIDKGRLYLFSLYLVCVGVATFFFFGRTP